RHGAVGVLEGDTSHRRRIGVVLRVGVGRRDQGDRGERQRAGEGSRGGRAAPSPPSLAARLRHWSHLSPDGPCQRSFFSSGVRRWRLGSLLRGQEPAAGAPKPKSGGAHMILAVTATYYGNLVTGGIAIGAVYALYGLGITL